MDKREHVDSWILSERDDRDGCLPTYSHPVSHREPVPESSHGRYRAETARRPGLRQNRSKCNGFCSAFLKTRVFPAFRAQRRKSFENPGNFRGFCILWSRTCTCTSLARFNRVSHRRLALSVTA